VTPDDRPTRPARAADRHGMPSPQTPEGRWGSREPSPMGSPPWPTVRARAASAATRHTACLVEGAPPPARTSTSANARASIAINGGAP
jgi:hypothetical protein